MENYLSRLNIEKTMAKKDKPANMQLVIYLSLGS